MIASEFHIRRAAVNMATVIIIKSCIVPEVIIPSIAIIPYATIPYNHYIDIHRLGSHCKNCLHFHRFISNFDPVPSPGYPVVSADVSFPELDSYMPCSSWPYLCFLPFRSRLGHPHRIQRWKIRPQTFWICFKKPGICCLELL